MTALVCDCEVIHEEAVAKARETEPPYGDFYALANLYKLFADQTRVRLLWALSGGELCVCDLAALLGMTKSAVSHQLKSLRLGSLVKYRREGKTVFYSLADSHVQDIFEKGMEHIHEKA
jgi:ArsR family transcriptional regulator